MDDIIKGSKVDKKSKMNLDKFKGCGLNSVIEDILLSIPKREKSKSLVCRSDKPDDATYRLLGRVILGVEEKRATYDLYLCDHYFFENSIVFKKIGRGGIGYTPMMWHVDNDWTTITEIIN